MEHDDGKSYEFSRWKDVEENREPRPEVDAIVVSCFVPFLSSFPALLKVYAGRYYIVTPTSAPFWLRLMGKNYLHLKTTYSRSNRNFELKRSLEFAVGGGYASGAIPQKVVVHNVMFRCGIKRRDGNEPGESCPHCTFCNETLPFKKAAYDAIHRCVPASAFVDSILKRKGGREYLTSRTFLLESSVYIPMRTRIAIECQKRGLVSTMSRQEVVEWLGSFGEVRPGIRHGLDCHYTQKAFQALGVPIKDSDYDEYKVKKYDTSRCTFGIKE